MTVMRALTWVELKLAFRDSGLVTFGVLFPAALLLLLGFAFPGFRDPTDDLGGARPVDLYAPIVLVFVLVMVGISTVSSVLATYRHDGILRRLRTTPVGPSRLLVAHLTAQLIVTVIGAALAVVAALAVLDVPAPTSWPGAITALLLAATCLFAIGLLVGAVAPSTSASHAISTLVWIPLMMLAGLWFPRELMPDTLRRASDLSPGGAGVDALQRAWFEGHLAAGSLTVLLVTSLVVGVVAVVTFRWD